MGDDNLFRRLASLDDIFSSFNEIIARRRRLFPSGQTLNFPDPTNTIMDDPPVQTHATRGNAIFITDMLKAYPVPDRNSNKVVLPPSLLKEIHDKKVWDSRPSDKPLIFELTVSDPDTDDILEETHVGVEKFTAPNGTIGLPYKTALCLTKERGVSWLREHPYVFLRYVELDKTAETKMQVQPRGKGFFREDDSVVQLDIKTLLELTLRDHLVLTAGDWIPLFYQGNRFELVVKDLQPNNVIDILNTDLTVELLPSEDTEQGLLEQKEAQQQVKDFMNARELRYKQKLVILNNIPEPPKDSEKGDKPVLVRVKLPKGGTIQRRFLPNDKVEIVLDFIEVELYKSDFVPINLPPKETFDFDISSPEVKNLWWFNLVYALPGRKKTVISSKSFGDCSLKETLERFEINTNAVSFNLEMIKDLNSGKDSDQNKDEGASKEKVQSSMYQNDWAKLADRLEANLVENESEPELLPEPEVQRLKSKVLSSLEIFETPETENNEQTEGAQIKRQKSLTESEVDMICRVYGKQLKVLEGMGYDQEPETFIKAVKMLKQRKGAIEEVVNALTM